VPLQYINKGVTTSTLSGVPKYYTFRVRGILQGQRVMTMIDGVFCNFYYNHYISLNCGDLGVSNQNNMPFLSFLFFV
jgi:hypothetical protein